MNLAPHGGRRPISTYPRWPPPIQAYDYPFPAEAVTVIVGKCYSPPVVSPRWPRPRAWCPGRAKFKNILPHGSFRYRPPAPETVLPNIEGPTYGVDGLRSPHQLKPRPTPTEDLLMGAGHRGETEIEVFGSLADILEITGECNQEDSAPKRVVKVVPRGGIEPPTP